MPTPGGGQHRFNARSVVPYSGGSKSQTPRVEFKTTRPDKPEWRGSNCTVAHAQFHPNSPNRHDLSPMFHGTGWGPACGVVPCGELRPRRALNPRRWDPIPKPQLPTHHMFSLDVVTSGQVQPLKGHFKRGRCWSKLGQRYWGGIQGLSLWATASQAGYGAIFKKGKSQVRF